MPAPTHNQPEYSVSELSAALRRTVEDSFSYVRVRGEISGCKRATSGHLYLDLKDANAVLNAVCWKGKASSFSFKPEDGLEVIATGKLSTYPGRSSYQLVIDSLEPAGAGALMALLEQRKKMLAAEGLFAAERKKPLPFMPQVIGVVTSPTGAVIRDILHRIGERFPCHVIVWPVAVQGESAAEQITAAIHGFNALPNPPDLLIVARGGGSIEDLWCFNEEGVVRAVAASKIPLISAVGHETDTTLIDYAADKRAPTPTAAAEMAVPVRQEWLISVEQTGLRLRQQMARLLEHRRERLEGYARGLTHPARLIDFASQKLDDLSERLSTSLPLTITRRQEKMLQLSARLSPATLTKSLGFHARDMAQLSERMNPAIERRMQAAERKLELQSKLFESLHYKNVLARGYALIRHADGRAISNAAAAKNASLVTVQFADGDVSAHIVGAPKPAKSKPQSAGQDSLF